MIAMKIFSINKGKNKKEYCLFGRRILTRDRVSNKTLLREISRFYNFFKCSIDISSMPPATGFLREKQLASLKILKIVAEFCKKEKITYWLEFGTLLGALRHKGFIPWDDDIDIGMLRDDFERFVDLFNQKNTNEDIEAIWFYHGDEYNLLKVQHKKIDGVWVDIFVRDLGYIPLTFEEKLAHTEEIKKLVSSNF